MDDLISRAAAINAVLYKPINKIAIEVLKEVPTVDAAPVVRCKDCVKHGAYNCSFIFENSPDPPDDWFCADGERRREDGE